MVTTNGHMKGPAIGAIAALHVPPTERARFGAVWVDMIVPNLANQYFRSRIAKLRAKDSDALDNMLGGKIRDFDEDGTVPDETIKTIFTCFIEDWGSFDDNDEAQPLYDESGDVVPCTLQNFTDVVQGTPGGAELFFLILDRGRRLAVSKTASAVQEKNSSAPSGAPCKSAKPRQTRKNRTAPSASTSSGRQSVKPSA